MDASFKKPMKRKRRATVAVEGANKRPCNGKDRNEMRSDRKEETSLRTWFEVYAKTVKRLELNSHNAYNVSLKKYTFNEERDHVFVVECCNYEGVAFKPFVIGEGFTRKMEFTCLRRDVSFEERHWLEWLEKVFLPMTSERTKCQTRPSLIVAEYQPQMKHEFMKKTRENRINVLLSSNSTQQLTFPLDAKFTQVLETHLYDVAYKYITTADQFWLKYKAARTIAKNHIQDGWHRSGFCPIRVDNALHLNKIGPKPPLTLEYDKGVYSQELATRTGSLYNSRCKSPLKPSENI